MSNTYTVEKKSETKSNSHHSPSIRIQVELFEPTENRYPVFNYQKLFTEEIKRRRRDQQSNSLDENDESIKQLADHYEQKYGTSGTSLKKKKKKKTTFYNYSELAAGYDENDSFIDNTEICDEVMPEEVETKHGGYYVNIGSLEFKKVCLSDDSKEIKSSQPPKHFTNSVLEDNDEKLPSFSNSSEKNSLSETKTSETSNISSSSDEDKESIQRVNRKKKRMQPIDSDSACSIIPIKKKKISMVKLSKQEKKVVIPECKPSCSKDTQSISSDEIPTSENNVSSINDTIESVIYAGFSKKLPKVIKSNSEHDIKITQNIINPPISNDMPVSNGIHNTVEDIPEIIVEIIELIKTEAQIAIQNNLNTFSDQINLYLLSLEYQKELSTFNIQSIYATLAEHMLCDKEKLIKQVNELINSEEIKIVKPIRRLKSAIDKVLPSVIKQYNLECNRILDQRTVNGTYNNGNGFKSKPGPKRPRRKFPWNDEFRGYLREIVNIRTTTYSKIKRSHPVDDYISQFINNRIKPLWPNGWMKTTNILKELKVKEKDSRPKLPKKQSLQNSPTKLLGAIKLASEHKVSNFAMNKSHKWNKQKFLKVPRLNTETTTVSTSHTLSISSTTTSNFKQLYNSPHSVTINNDICPYEATITTTAINGCKQKEPENSSVIVKPEKLSGDNILDLSPNKSNSILFAFNKLKDVTVICNNASQDNNSSAKTDLQISSKLMIHQSNQPISRKQRLLQEVHNKPLSDQQRLSTHITTTVDQQIIKPKDEKLILSSNKLDCIKVDDKSTAKDMLSQIINESLMDNTSPLPSQFTTNNLYKPKEDAKLSSSNVAKQNIKKEYSEWPQNDRNPASRTPSNHRSSSAELTEKESQELIRDLLVLNQLNSCSSRNIKNNTYKKHLSSATTYSSHSPDTLVNSPLGVIHHPAYRNTYSSTNNAMCKSKNELSHGAKIGIPKMNIGLQDEFLKHMKTDESGSRLTTDNYQKYGMSNYSLIQNNTQSSDNLFQQQFYSTLNTKSNQDISHNTVTYSNTND